MNAKQIWQAALVELERRVTRANFETWVRHVGAVSLENGGVLTLRAPSTFAQEWLSQRLMPEIAEVVAGLVGKRVEVRLVVGEAEPRKRSRRTAAEATPGLFGGAEAEDQPVEGVASSGAPDPARAEVTFSATGASEEWRPNARYTFESFIVGSSNQLAHAAAQSVAERPGLSYNPLFIYGGVGLGKTHLLHAIAHVAIAQGHRTLYVTSEEFTNDLIHAIRGNKTEEFRRYRRNEVLLVDDIQFIAGKESTQEEFFHTFNALHNANRQIVLSSDRSPRAMTTLEDRLRSRFEWGLIADVQAPDYETRMAILQAKADEQPTPIPPSVIAYVAQRVQSNIRELEGSLNRVVAYARLNGRPLTPDTATAALSEILGAPAARRYINPNQVIEVVGRYYKLDGRTLRGKGRDREVVVPRQIAMYLMREETNSSLSDIGRELSRDHSTVLHGCTKIQGDIEADAALRRDVLAIRELLYASARP